MLLHFEKDFVATAKSDLAAPSSETTPSSKEAILLVSLTSVARSNTVVLLSTVRAEIADVHGHFFPVRILLDSASQSHFIIESCSQRGGFKRSPCHTTVLGLNDTKAAITKGRTSFVLRASNRNDLRVPVEATILSRISSQIPNVLIESHSWDYLKDLQLADPEYNQDPSIFCWAPIYSYRYFETVIVKAKWVNQTPLTRSSAGS